MTLQRRCNGRLVLAFQNLSRVVVGGEELGGGRVRVKGGPRGRRGEWETRLGSAIISVANLTSWAVRSSQRLPRWPKPEDTYWDSCSPTMGKRMSWNCLHKSHQGSYDCRIVFPFLTSSDQTRPQCSTLDAVDIAPANLHPALQPGVVLGSKTQS